MDRTLKSPPSSGGTRPLSLTRKLIYALVATLLGLLILEGSVRLVVHETRAQLVPEQIIQAHVRAGGMTFDPQLGWFWKRLPQPEQGLNAVGFRYGIEVNKRKQDGGWRAFTLGDSQTYGAHLHANRTYTYLAEVRLRVDSGLKDKLELINAGISGFTSLQALRMIRLRLLEYHPDLIIIDSPLFDSPRESADGLVVMNPTLERFLLHSRLFYLMRLGWSRLRAPEISREETARHFAFLSQGPKDRPGNHDLIARLGGEQGFETLFLDYPTLQQDEVSCHEPGVALPHGHPIAHICEALQQSGHPAQALFYDGNHMTELGAEIAAVEVARMIRSMKLLPTAP